MIDELKRRSIWLRQELVEMVALARKGHIPSSFSCAEMVIALFYGGFFKSTPQNPKDPSRDRIFVSKGHAGMVLYPILADLGFFSKEELKKFTKADGILRMYPDPSIPGIEAITGSLGHGFGIACGHAMVAKRDGNKAKSFVILGDGECYEGSTWETAMFAAHHNLDNLCIIVDRNRLCILDNTENVLKLGSLEEKWKAFGWQVASVNAHSYKEVIPALEQFANNKTGKPFVIIAHSVKGKGISYMENRPEWHNKIPDAHQFNQAREEIRMGCIHD